MRKVLFTIIIAFILLSSFCARQYEKEEDKISHVGNPKKIATFSEIGKAYRLLINKKHVFINDNNFLYAYSLDTFKLIKKLNKIGEGPGEFKNSPLVVFSNDKIILQSLGKIAILDKSFNYIQEIRTFVMGQAVPIGKNFIIEGFVSNIKEYKPSYIMVDKKFKKIKDIIFISKEYVDNKHVLFLFTQHHTRVWRNKLFISQPYKGIYIDVFDKNGNYLYNIDKKVKKIKVEKKHIQLREDELLSIMGKKFGLYKRAKMKEKNMQKYVPDMNDFWVIGDSIYVKTHDIKNETEKYIIMDLKGNIVKIVFLPIVIMDMFTFHDDKFYYLKDNGKNESWDLYSIQL